MPVPTRTIPEVSTIADSMSPMTLNDTDHLPEDASEFAHMRRTTDAAKGYRKEPTVDNLEDNSPQTSEGIFSIPHEPYPSRSSPPIATNASTVRVRLVSKLYDSESNLQSQLFDPDSKQTIQADDNQDTELQDRSFDFDDDNDDGDKDNTTPET